MRYVLFDLLYHAGRCLMREPLVLRREVLDGRGPAHQAVSAFRKLIEIEPKNALGQNGLGGALFDQGKFAEAEAAFREAIRLHPAKALYHSSRGSALCRIGRFSEATPNIANAGH